MNHTGKYCSSASGYTDFANEPITFGDFSFPRLPDLVCWADGVPDKRCLFIADQKDTFSVSFEAGMECMDLGNQNHAYGLPNIHSEYRCGNKYIHQIRTDPRERPNAGNYAFFHIELTDKEGQVYVLPGQMVATSGYEWSDTVEPVLLNILNGISLITIQK